MPKKKITEQEYNFFKHKVQFAFDANCEQTFAESGTPVKSNRPAPTLDKLNSLLEERGYLINLKQKNELKDIDIDYLHEVVIYLNNIDVHALEQDKGNYAENDKISIYSYDTIDESTIEIVNKQMTFNKRAINEPKRTEPLIYVWTEDEKIIAAKKEKKDQDGITKHVSLSLYKPVRAAGDLCIENGKITLISNASGHYKPTWQNLYNFIIYLEQQELLAPNAEVIHTYSDKVVDSTLYNSMTIDEFKTRALSGEYEISQSSEKDETFEPSEDSGYGNPRSAKRKKTGEYKEEKKQSNSSLAGWSSEEDDFALKRTERISSSIIPPFKHSSSSISAPGTSKKRPQNQSSYNYEEEYKTNNHWQLFRGSMSKEQKQTGIFGQESDDEDIFSDFYRQSSPNPSRNHGKETREASIAEPKNHGPEQSFGDDIEESFVRMINNDSSNQQITSSSSTQPYDPFKSRLR